MKKLNVWMFVTTLAFVILPGFSYGQPTVGDFRSNGSGAWNDSTNWDTFNGTDWVADSSHPNNSSGLITIRTGDTITVNTFGHTADQVVIDSSGVLIVKNGGLTIVGNSESGLSVSGILEGGPLISESPGIRFKKNSKYEHKDSTSPGTILAAIWDSGSTCVIKGYTTNDSVPAGLNQSFHHFKWDCPGQTTSIDATLDTISVNGDFTVANTGSGSVAATVKMKGTSSQSFSAPGTLANTSNLIIDNTTGVSLASSVAIKDLKHVAGNLHLGNNDITIGGAVSGVAASKCIVTANGDSGKVVRAIAASESFTFPVGPTSTSYNPVTLALNAGDPTETFHVRVDSGMFPDFPNPAFGVQRTLDISEDTPGENNVTLSFQWSASDAGASFSTGAAVFFFHYDTSDSQWKDVVQGTVTGTDPYTMTSDSTVSDFSRWSAGNSGGLPVELVSFSATAQAFAAHLSWSTATETDNAGWEIERSSRQSTVVSSQTEENGWVKVGFVEGAGTSTSPREYTFTDSPPVASPSTRSTSLGTTFAYRLKQIDRNGSFTYTGEAEVELGIVPRVLTLDNNYPNPFNPATSLSFSLPNDGYAALRVYDVLGREIATLFEGPAEGGKAYQFTFDAVDLPSGTYFARLESDGGGVMRKLVLMK